MTARAHARRRLLGRLADRARTRRPAPDRITMLTHDFGDGPKITGFAYEQPRGWQIPAGYDTSYDHPGREDAEVQGIEQAESGTTWHSPDAKPRADRPPWMTAPQPALAGPGALGPYWAAEDLRGQAGQLAAEHEALYGWGGPPPVPAGIARPYSPENEPAPLPEPAAVFPPLDLHDDLDDCVIFRAAIQAHFVRQEHARGRRAQPGETWLQEHARVYRERFTGELDDIARRAMAAPYPDFALAEATA